MRNKVTYQRPRAGRLAVSGTTDISRSHVTEIYRGLVEDVIVDHLHKNYSPIDGYNVGAVQIRLLDISEIITKDQLDWAFPIDCTLSELPLRGEMVELHKILGRFYYTRKIPIAHRIQENSALNLNSLLEDIGNARSEVENSSDPHEFGNYFRPDRRVRPLKHFEGDTILQGRMGNSIRLGSSVMSPGARGLAPNIILRTGQAKNKEEEAASFDTVFGVVVEDINDDASSIWMVSDQKLPFRPTTKEAGSFYRSIASPVFVWDGASNVINSDRILINSKKNHIMLFSNEEIYLNSYSRTSIDTDESIFLTANIDINSFSSRSINNIADEDFTVRAGDDVLLLSRKKISLASNKVYIGGIENDSEPLVGGTSLAIFLARLISVLMGAGIPIPQPPYQLSGAPTPLVVPPPPVPGIATFAHVITPLGPGQLNPAIVAGLNLLYLDLVLPNTGQRIPVPGGGAVFNSRDNFVGLSNQDPSVGIVLNEFQSGNQIETENNEWNLSDDYYGVA